MIYETPKERRAIAPGPPIYSPPFFAPDDQGRNIC